MTWFEAWLIMRLDAINGLCTGFLILFCVSTVCCMVAWGYNASFDEERDKILAKCFKKWTWISGFLAIPFMLLTILIPNTNTFFKIAALKYGVDVIKTEQAQNTGKNILDSVEKASKLLDVKLQKLLEETQPPQKEAPNK